MKKVLLIGSNGLLGSSLVKVLQPLFKLITVTRTSQNSDYNLDMASKSKSSQLFSEVKPDLIINLAALTNVDTCEENIDLAYRVNSRIAENIANNTSSFFIISLYSAP